MWRLFFQGLGEVTVEAFFLDLIVMLLFSLILIYLITVILLSSPFYRSEGARALVDTDERVKLCAGWAIQFVFFALLFILFWIWYRALLPTPVELSFWIRQ